MGTRGGQVWTSGRVREHTLSLLAACGDLAGDPAAVAAAGATTVNDVAAAGADSAGIERGPAA
jgi:hypothetical protein